MEIITKFTERSNNPNNYGELHANLKTPYTQYSTLLIDSLKSIASFEIINEDDYLKFNEGNGEILINPIEKYSDLNSSSLSTLINQL